MNEKSPADLTGEQLPTQEQLSAKLVAQYDLEMQLEEYFLESRFRILQSSLFENERAKRSCSSWLLEQPRKICELDRLIGLHPYSNTVASTV